MSTQTVMTHAINSSEFMDVLSLRSIGISHRQAAPVRTLYPPPQAKLTSIRSVNASWLPVSYDIEGDTCIGIQQEILV